jgi:hypothetical protein
VVGRSGALGGRHSALHPGELEGRSGGIQAHRYLALEVHFEEQEAHMMLGLALGSREAPAETVRCLIWQLDVLVAPRHHLGPLL